MTSVTSQESAVDRRPPGEQPGDLPPWLSSDALGLKSRFVDIDGHDIHYVDEGDGPTLLFVHGNMAWSFVYRDVILELRDSFRCVAPDLPGFGLSRAGEGYAYTPAEHAAVLDELTTTLALSDVVLMGNDWGGPIGLAVAAARPARFRGVILANTWAWPVDDDPRFRRFSTYLGSAVGRAALKRVRPFFELLLAQTYRRRELTKAEATLLRGPFRAPRQRVPSAILVREITGSRAWLAELHAKLRELADHPALLIWGERDAAFTAEHRRRLKALFSRAATVLLADAGNFVTLDAPSEVAEAIRDWHPIGVRNRS